jgi:endonuclease G, mitochondrial
MSSRVLIGLVAGVAAIASTNGHAEDKITAGEDCAHIFVETGIPEMEGDTAQTEQGHVFICRDGYAVYLNTETRNPDWVAEDVTAEEVKGKAKRKDNFAEDHEVRRPASASLHDYAASGFDRGHQAPAADFKNSQKRTDESFLLTNMAPQIGQCFNRRIWAQLEDDVRDLAATRKRLIVFTGPVYSGPVKTIGQINKKMKDDNVAVPSSFYKIVYHPATKRAMAFLLPNKKLCKRDPKKFLTSIRHVEELTGVDFFPALSRRDRTILEKSVGNLWGW